MEPTRLIFNLYNSVDSWLEELGHYDLKELLKKPSPNAWSLGQVYVHIIRETTFFLQQAKICATSKEHSTEDSTSEAKSMFKENAFPDRLLEGPPSNDNIPQPNSIAELQSQLLDLKTQAGSLKDLISFERSLGKTKHPGFNYFSATEWLQFAEMHLRHHFRQKARIDVFLELDKE